MDLSQIGTTSPALESVEIYSLESVEICSNFYLPGFLILRSDELVPQAQFSRQIFISRNQEGNNSWTADICSIKSFEICSIDVEIYSIEPIEIYSLVFTRVS